MRMWIACLLTSSFCLTQSQGAEGLVIGPWQGLLRNHTSLPSHQFQVQATVTCRSSGSRHESSACGGMSAQALVNASGQYNLPRLSVSGRGRPEFKLSVRYLGRESVANAERVFILTGNSIERDLPQLKVLSVFELAAQDIEYTFSQPMERRSFLSGPGRELVQGFSLKFLAANSFQEARLIVDNALVESPGRIPRSLWMVPGDLAPSSRVRLAAFLGLHSSPQGSIQRNEMDLNFSGVLPVRARTFSLPHVSRLPEFSRELRGRYLGTFVSAAADSRLNLELNLNCSQGRIQGVAQALGRLPDGSPFHGEVRVDGICEGERLQLGIFFPHQAGGAAVRHLVAVERMVRGRWHARNSSGQWSERLDVVEPGAAVVGQMLISSTNPLER